MSDQFLGEIRPFGFNFAPTGWALCNGQIMSISQNAALFSLLGTFYGGNGTSTFALPNLQGNISISQGNGPGLSQYFLGETGGSATVTLLTNQIALHTHTLPVGTSRTGVEAPGPGVFLAGDARGEKPVFVTPTVQAANPVGMASSGSSSGSQPHNNLMPYLVLNYCIALRGVFPARN